jgi:hypothetical protein
MEESIQEIFCVNAKQKLPVLCKAKVDILSVAGHVEAGHWLKV